MSSKSYTKNALCCTDFTLFCRFHVFESSEKMSLWDEQDPTYRRFLNAQQVLILSAEKIQYPFVS